MPALYAGKRVGKPLMRGHTYNAMFNGKLVWPLDKDTVVSIRITDAKAIGRLFDTDEMRADLDAAEERFYEALMPSTAKEE